MDKQGRIQICFMIGNTPEITTAKRAEEFAKRLPKDRFNFTSVLYKSAKRGTLSDLLMFLNYALFREHDILYLIEPGVFTTYPALLGKYLAGKKVVLDTGDLHYELSKLRHQSRIRQQYTRLTEFVAQKISNAIVVRGSFHKELLEKQGYRNVYHIPDGVNTMEYSPRKNPKLKKELGLSGSLVIAEFGRSLPSRDAECYVGRNLLETIRYLKDENVKGLFIGEGEEFLKQKAREYGIQDKMVFTGYIPHMVVEFLSLADILIATQQDHPTTWVRTTGRLPKYLSLGKYTIHPAVGDATDIVPQFGVAIPYKGIYDPEFPKKAAQEIKKVLKNKKLLQKGRKGRRIAIEHYDYRVLAKKVAEVMEDMMNSW